MAFSGSYILVGAVAAVTTAVATPIVRSLALRAGRVTEPDVRRVHTKATPSVGGVAMYLGFLAAFGVASKLPRFATVFQGSRLFPLQDWGEPVGVVVAATIIMAVGLVDDLRKSDPKATTPEGISAPAKVAGLVVAGVVLVLVGVTMWYFRVPGFLGKQTIVLPPTFSPLVLILWLLGMTNAINLIDGLDGLAAGIVAIGSGAFFLFARNLDNHQLLTGGPNLGPLVAIIVLGMCLGFLPYNVHPARIFMGDCGALLLGGLMAVCTAVVGGRVSPAEGSLGAQGQTFFFFGPLLIPLVILGVPLFDVAFAIVRRTTSRQGITGADKGHLHHRLLRLGHGHRRSVFILWLWTAILSGVVLYPIYNHAGNGVVLLAILALGLILYTVLHPEVRRRHDTTDGE